MDDTVFNADLTKILRVQCKTDEQINRKLQRLSLDRCKDMQTLIRNYTQIHNYKHVFSDKLGVAKVEGHIIKLKPGANVIECSTH